MTRASQKSEQISQGANIQNTCVHILFEYLKIESKSGLYSGLAQRIPIHLIYSDGTCVNKIINLTEVQSLYKVDVLIYTEMSWNAVFHF